jgi:hypothetical protein
MMQNENVAPPPTPVDEIQKNWHELNLKVNQLEAARSALEQENKNLRFLLERIVEHRQKSHNELVLILTALVSKLPLNDVGVIVSKLVEHNTNVSHTLAGLAKGTEIVTAQPAILKNLDQTKRDLLKALKPVVEELIKLETPLETDMLQGLLTEPEKFFSPRMVRANRGFIKGQIPRERIVREFGEEALVFFKDMTTDPKVNPNPKRDEIALAFRSDFEGFLGQQPAFPPEKRAGLQALHQRVQRSKAATDQARNQRAAFQKLSFIIELLHYYENQNTEAPDLIFAQRLPALVEQLVVTGPEEPLDEKLILQAEDLLTFIINPDHRLMVINNVGKGAAAGKTLKYVMRLRADKASDPHHTIAEFIRHLVPAQNAPAPAALASVFRLVDSGMQRQIVKAIMVYDRLRKGEAEALGKAVAAELSLKGIDEELKAQEAVSPEQDRQMAWARIKENISQRTDPAAIANAIRDRLNAKYDSDEIRQSWITLTEADPMTLIRIFCQLPYLTSGKTDPIARPVLETYASRLTHEKYAATYQRVVNSLKNMFHAKADSPTLLNFMALVRWVSPEAADKLCADVGMPVPAH